MRPLAGAGLDKPRCLNASGSLAAHDKIAIKKLEAAAARQIIKPPWGPKDSPCRQGHSLPPSPAGVPNLIRGAQPQDRSPRRRPNRL